MINERFFERMRGLLGEEYSEFEAALGEAAVRGIRVNTLKLSVADFKEIWRGGLLPLGYTRDGFIPECGEGIGNTPEHHAGLIYVQDPGAMAPLNAIDIPEGARVLDVCSAPGGKSAQIAAMIGESGFLHANEYVPKRAKITVGNLERLGVRSAVVTSLDTAELGELYSEFFDVVVCDAPCSGEGMFRKSEEAIEDWSEENVAACRERQLMILENVLGTLKSGGLLLYSTCTYSIEENEGVISELLRRHPELRLIPAKDAVCAVTADGIALEGRSELRLTRRFYPHRSRGEGQFLAVLEKRESEENTTKKKTILYKNTEIPLSKQEVAIVSEFFKKSFKSIPRGRLIKQGEGISLIPFDTPIPPSRVFMAGVMVGEIKGKLLFPHHQLFSAYGDMMKSGFELTDVDGAAERYLRGEELLAENMPDGWCAVRYHGCSLGGGKVSAGRLKNHYPKGLRLKG